MVLDKDYAMNNCALSIETNASLILYVLDTYHIDLHTQKSNQQGQQIVLGNFETLKSYLMI